MVLQETTNAVRMNLPAQNKMPQSYPRNNYKRIGFVLLCLILQAPPGVLAVLQKGDDPYQILGISRRADLEDIKRAYRSKARENHPDKTPELDPIVANENFRRIQDAFEILTDPVQRRQHEEELRRQEVVERAERKRHRELKQKAELVQDRVSRFSTLEELQRSVGNNVYKKHLIMAFVGNKKAEKFLDGELLFPYPYAGSGPNGFEWDDHVEVAKVRYNKPTSFTEAFKIPINYDRNIPYVVVCKKGDQFGRFQVFRQLTSSKSWIIQRSEMEKWIDNQILHHTVKIVNNHQSAVRLFRYDRQQNTYDVGSLLPGHSTVVKLHSTDRLRALDSRTDAFPGSSGFITSLFFRQSKDNHAQIQKLLLMDTLIAHHDDGSEIGIESKQCYDLSMKCHDTIFRDQRICDNHSEIMHGMCAASCNICTESSWNPIRYVILHYPLDKLPVWLQPAVQVLRAAAQIKRTFWNDMEQLISMRRNVAFCFLLVGILIGWNRLFLKQLKRATMHRTQLTHQGHFRRTDILMLPSCVTIISLALLFINEKQAPFKSLQGIHSDLQFVFMKRGGIYLHMDAMASVLAIGCIGWNVVCSLLDPRVSSFTYGRVGGIFHRMICSWLVVFLLGLAVHGAADWAMKANPERNFLWGQLSIRKNALAAIGLIGLLLGATIRPFLMFAWSLKKFLLQVTLTNATVLVPMACILLNDKYIEPDMTHVLRYHKTAAGLFAVVGCLIGPMLLRIPSAAKSLVARKNKTSDQSIETRKDMPSSSSVPQ